MGIKEKVKQWFLGPSYTEESLRPIEDREQFMQTLKLGCPVAFRMRDGYGLILFEEQEELGVVYVKDAFGVHEDYRSYFTLPDLITFFNNHRNKGISFYALNN
ncbi:hypothetical protein [Fictibacillus phosphorivorans]|uniref:hypothetical protein n=1 Tax=Fictibacillus phosphorivorans TaxID=1221500 RepID=UPI002041E6C6|nr:hypothetical protein [Fictibacillus phosphorivorans]MCM3718275.1 hypothetical protein [Fictibacillus phosphorivorans]MCM3775859.1 hypothetical protein [Fictibacillus phosphorivorans]